MEMSIECVYPMPEATPTGFLFVGGKLIGIIVILIDQAAAQTVTSNTYSYQKIQTCVSINSTLNSTLLPLIVLDYKYPVVGQTSLVVLITIIFIIFFKCPYSRLNHEKSVKAAVKINIENNFTNQI